MTSLDDTDQEEFDLSASVSKCLSHLYQSPVLPSTPGGTSGDSSSCELPQASPGFAIKETRNQSKIWIKDFKLPETVSFIVHVKLPISDHHTL